MIVKIKEDMQLVFAQFYLNGKVLNMLNVCNKVTYLGHFCTDDLNDDADIERQCHRLYSQSNTLVGQLQKSKLTCAEHVLHCTVLNCDIKDNTAFVHLRSLIMMH